jgi:hypothetical protein
MPLPTFPQAIISSAFMSISLLLVVAAKAFTVAMPILMPVNDPGPVIALKHCMSEISKLCNLKACQLGKRLAVCCLLSAVEVIVKILSFKTK